MIVVESNKNEKVVVEMKEYSMFSCHVLATKGGLATLIVEAFYYCRIIAPRCSLD